MKIRKAICWKATLDGEFVQQKTREVWFVKVELAIGIVN